MKIYLKRDTSDENSRYIVYSETGEEMYKIIGKRKTSIDRVYITNDDKCIAKIRDTHLGMIRSCYVTTQSDSFHIVMTTSRDKISITFHGISYHIRGDVLNKSYDILDVDNSVVGCVCRRFNSSADALELNFDDKKHELNIIASAVFLDTVCTVDSMALQTT